MCTLAAAWIYLVLKLSIRKRGEFDEDFSLANTSLLWHCYEAREKKRTMSSIRELCVYYKKHSSMDKKEWTMSILMNQYTGLLSHLRAWMRETPCLLCIIGQKICNTGVPRQTCLWSLKRGLFSLAISWVLWVLIVSSDFQKPHKSPFI